MRGDDGSAAVEFVLVGTLLTALTAAVIQLGIALYARNIIHDAAVSGAYAAAVVDAGPADAEDAVRGVTGRTLGADVVQGVSVRRTTLDGEAAVAVTVTATLPLIGLIGPQAALEVTGHAPLETFDVD